MYRIPRLCQVLQPGAWRASSHFSLTTILNGGEVFPFLDVTSKALKASVTCLVNMGKRFKMKSGNTHQKSHKNGPTL